MDRQGIQRGRCNECSECTEYVAPSTGARCDYCGHVPTKHVQIIKLGPCKKCDGECEEYISEEKTSYTDCQYCGCKAADHKGAEKHMQVAASSAKVEPDSPSSSTASVIIPMCKYPGCTKHCFLEKGKTHQFCGKTHALQYDKRITKMNSVTKPQVTKTIDSSKQQPCNESHNKLPPPPSYTSVVTSSTYSVPRDTTSTTKICFDCRKNPVNKGYNICEQCYVHRTT